ncbi:MAG: protein-L-isoaspartate(D-aspartate) O-methyltransferase [Spirochaetota bacterium]|nr:MAG: protein-L-isoaspartate(D-aspartate) O-methyltransferase [Spirochaetota bacterium]
MKKSFILVCCVIFLLVIITGNGYADYEAQRRRLVKNHIENEGIDDRLVLDSMLSVPREKFVPQDQKRQAYLNVPLPIGYGQTISQPYIVAIMTQLLNVNEDDVVLEIGTGSGYQAAVLAEIVKEVYTVEIIEPLGIAAKTRLKRLGYENVEVHIGDGYFGWKEHSPYDAIMVTAAADHIPPPLIRQLKNGGRMCIPVGPPYFPQVLKLLEKNEKGEVRIWDVLPVRFVPLTRAVDWKDKAWE